MSHEIRCYDYVDHGYEQVRDALAADALEIFHAATKAAASRAHSLAASLRVNVSGIELGTEIAISVRKFDDHPGEAMFAPASRLELEWEAASMPHLFPFMAASFYVYPMTANETRLELSGRYEPPLGAIGEAIDAVVGHRIAEASVHRFLADVADYLRERLPEAPRRGGE